MKSLVLAAAAVVALGAGQAFAADLMAPAPEVSAPAVDTSSWTGPYIGGQLGYLLGKAPSPDQGWENDPAGWLAGAFGGYNANLGGVVIGVEGGLNWSNATNSVKTGTAGERFKTDVNWETSLVGRLGVPVDDNTLIYALGGVSVVHLTGQYIHNPPPDAPAASASVAGLAIGVGAEFKLAGGIGLRGEYRYAAYQPADLTCTICGTTTQNLTTNAITIGLVAHW